MIGYICKYTPIEIFESMGLEMKRIEPEVASFNQADTLMHPNICSFAKGVLEDVLANHYEGIILTTCCDSIRRLYDVLVEKLPDTFIYILDIPRITKDGGIKLYELRIREMLTAYEKFSGKKLDEKKLEAILQRESENQRSIHPAKGTRIGILGARANKSIHKILEEHGAEVAFDITCTGLDRKLLYEKDNVFTGYVRGLLSQFPCMRMETAANRDLLIQKYADSADGIIYHTVQFCDSYSYEYAWLKEIIQKPLLLLETDNTTQSYGQILTRMEAFLESVQKSGNDRKKLAKQKIRTSEGEKTMYVMGIDSGSTSTNAVIMDDARNIKAFSVIRTGAKSGESAERILADVLEKARLKKRRHFLDCIHRVRPGQHPFRR